jgi:hypothetical protein
MKVDRRPAFFIPLIVHPKVVDTTEQDKTALGRKRVALKGDKGRTGQIKTS